MRVVMFDGLAEAPRVSVVGGKVLGEGFVAVSYVQEGGFYSGLLYHPSELPEGVVIDEDAVRRIQMAVPYGGDDSLPTPYESEDCVQYFEVPVQAKLSKEDVHNDWWQCPIEMVAWVVGEDYDVDEWWDNDRYVFIPDSMYEA